MVDNERSNLDWEQFEDILRIAHLTIDGFTLKPLQTIPDIGAPCGRFFTFRDFIKCGETQNRTQIPNIPIQPATYTALAHGTYGT